MSDAPAAPPPQDDKLFVPSGPTAPPVEPSAADMPVSSALFRRPPHLRAVLRAGLYALVVALLLPYLLVPLYAFVTPPSTPMLWRYLTGQRVVRTVVALEEVASAIPLAVIAAEDQRFCEHGGVDWAGLWQAIEEAEDVEDLRGGSTLTQQTVKNLFLWQGRSYLRKALEFPLSLWADLVLSKPRVMELYLNVAEWGPAGEFGVDAGARRAFGRPASRVGAGEAAVLAAVLPNPRLRNARSPGPGVRRLAGIYERRAATLGPLAACLPRTRGP
ncbi:MAG: monofunctional biosynthetic peptidoglycan transglycosylase [Alphaproteobacteria bacterium]|nr:MAG: monofunctional biosynthetic peptidoglycan transglycosylase [Alphaproteobacteria bacterium]